MPTARRELGEGREGRGGGEGRRREGAGEEGRGEEGRGRRGGAGGEEQVETHTR